MKGVLINNVWNKVSILIQQNSATGESLQQADLSSSPSSSSSSTEARPCPVLAAFYENITTPWSADKYVRLCSIVTTSRVAGAQHKRLVYTTTSNQLYIHVVNVSGGLVANDHVLLRFDGSFKARFPLPELTARVNGPS